VKRFARLLIAGAGLAGGLAATNRALGRAPLPTNALAGTRLPWNWRGHELFAVEAGSGPLVVLVHGLAPGASSYEYRRLFPLLAAHHRVVAFDFLGCGLSDKPKLDYVAELFVEQILDALRTFGDASATLVGASLGATFAIRATTQDATHIARVVAICPSGLRSAEQEAPRRVPVTPLVRTPLVGEALYNALASRASIRWFLQRDAYGDPARATAEVVDHYYAVTHQPGARYVPAAFLGGRLDSDLARDLPFLTQPLLVLWGDKAPATNPRANADEIVRLAKDARLATFAESGSLPHEEEPEAVASAIESFRTFMSP
jgi:pimeloyl-ACP methyl ester carboxylesterase